MPDKKVEMSDATENVLEFGPLVIDVKSKKVKIKGLEIHLTKSEFEILFMLASEPSRVYSRLQIVNAIRDNSARITMASIEVHISNLRKKLGHGSRCIFNRQGFGYEFDPRVLLQ